MTSPVLQQIKNSEANKDFDPNELFAETHRKRKKNKEPLLPGTFLTSAFASESSFASDTSYEDVLAPEDDDTTFYDHYESMDNEEEPQEDDEDDDTETEEVGDDDSPPFSPDFYGYSEDADLLPPSPPRSPPQDIDPDKLYGLYDFSGPDPLHCTLSRDEPVNLLNDLDDYWWLIRKLTKQEKLSLRNKRNKALDPDCPSDTESMLSDHDDEGKVGFVPAECLETYGERLARLNCFKNEELEKFADPLTEEGLAISSEIRRHVEDSDSRGSSTPPDGDKTNPISVYSEDLPDNSIANGTSLSNNSLGRASSLKQGNTRRRNKSVTFEAAYEELRLLILDEEDPETHHEFAESYVTTITKEDLDKFQAPPEEEKRSEVLSDVFPEAPLVISKSRKDKSITPNQRNGTGPKEVEEYPEPEFKEESNYVPTSQHYTTTLNPPVSLFRAHAPADQNSIGSYSPDTPRADHGRFEDDNLATLSRSVIIDRLNQVTTDIEGLNFDDYGYYDKLDDEEDDMARQGSMDSVLHRENDEIPSTTPLTSVNSFNNSNNNTTAEVAEKRKSRAMHEMFVPILGKFDELAEKLAELENMF